jgi:hypothetical protein
LARRKEKEALQNGATFIGESILLKLLVVLNAGAEVCLARLVSSEL